MTVHSRLFHSNLLSTVVVRTIFLKCQNPTIYDHSSSYHTLIIISSYIQYDLGFPNRLEIESMVLIEQLPSERTELQQKHLNIKWLKYINFGQKDVLAEIGLVGGCTNQNHTAFKCQKGILKCMKRIKN